jgi:hypothetical protein
MRHILLALIFVFAAFPLPAEAQSPPIDWEIGWETETDPEIMELNGKDSRLNSQNFEPASGDMTFSLTIEFWIDNPRPLPVQIEFEFFFGNTRWDFGATANHPGEATIDALSNESFSLEFWGDGFLRIMGQTEKSGILVSGDNIYEFSLTATEVIAGESTPTEAKEIEKSLQFSKYNALALGTRSNHDTHPKSITSQSVYAGSDESIRVLTYNVGNVADTIIDAEVEIKSCPQLVIEGLEGVVGKSLYLLSLSSTLTITAPQSHPQKECEVVFKVRSEGSGLWYSNNQKFTINVIAPEAEDDTNDDTSSSDQETGSGDLEINDSGILPSLTILSTLSMVGFAAILGRDER